jgi:hypothetical protein
LQENPASLQVAAAALRDWWHDWVNQCVLNLAWVLAWLTIILGPPATLGLVYVNERLAHGDSLGLRGLVEGGQRYFFISWLWMVINLLALATIAVNYVFYASFTSAWFDLLQAFFLLLALAWLLVQFYALPYLVVQESKNIFLAMRNALFTALAAPGFSLVLGVIALLIALVSVFTVAPLFLGGPCLIVMLGNHAVIERLHTYKVRERQ